jgi:hypothetical protein
MVPKKGLEPPHPCEYMDLNHARLPIPPLRHYVAPDQTRRCDGKYSSILKGLLNVSNPEQPRHPAPRRMSFTLVFIRVNQWYQCSSVVSF